MGGMFILIVLGYVNTGGQETDGPGMCRLCVLDTQQSGLALRAHEVFIESRQELMRRRTRYRNQAFPEGTECIISLTDNVSQIEEESCSLKGITSESQSGWEVKGAMGSAEASINHENSRSTRLFSSYTTRLDFTAN